MKVHQHLVYVFVFSSVILFSCNGGSSVDKTQKIKDINVKGCMSALIQNNLADSATAREYCECKVNKMFETYTLEEIMSWGELPQEEKDRREAEITKDCESLLYKNDSLQ